MLKHFLGAAPMFIPVLNNPRAAQATEVAAACNALPPAAAVAVKNLPEALARSAAVLGAGANADPLRPLLLTGSLYLLAEFFTLYPDVLEARPPAPDPGKSGTAPACGREHIPACTAQPEKKRRSPEYGTRRAGAFSK